MKRLTWPFAAFLLRVFDVGKFEMGQAVYDVGTDQGEPAKLATVDDTEGERGAVELALWKLLKMGGGKNKK